MKVLQILPELNAGGVERGTLELGRHLARHGHTSLVVSHGGRLVERLEAEGSRHLTLPVHRKHPSSLLQVKALRALFAEEQPNIVHVRSRVPAWLAWLALRQMDPKTRPRFVTTVHGFYSVNPYSAIMTRGERVICVSESVRDYVRQYYPYARDERLTVIPRGVDPIEFPFGHTPSEEWIKGWYQEFPEAKGKFLLTLPGRITRLKGHDDFLKIIESLKGLKAHGLIVGGAHPKKADYLKEIQNRAVERGIREAITLTGARDDLREIMSISGAVLSLTNQPESFGRTTLEALALGCPVAGYDHGGVGEQLDALLPEGKIPVGDTNAMAQRLARWARTSPSPARPNPFTLASMLDQTLTCYHTLIVEQSPRERGCPQPPAAL